MAQEPILYDLTLLLSSDVPEDRRTRILSAVEAAITNGGGSIERNDDWGRRPMAYEIRHQPEAEYHLLQFHAPPTLIEELSHTLHITDGVLRFRIIKVRRGTPPVKPGAPPVVAAVAASSSSLSGSSQGESRSGSSRPPSAAAGQEEASSAGAPAPEPVDTAAGTEEPASAVAGEPADDGVG